MDTPEEFIQGELASPYPRWDILAKLPLEVTAPFYPLLKQKWEDRNLRSFGDVLRSFPLGEFGESETIPKDSDTSDKHAEIQAWIQALQNTFIEIATEAVKQRFDQTARPIE